MGKSQWQCMEELIRIIQQDVVEFPQVSVLQVFQEFRIRI